jgi:Sec-independent protein secretion pathway components
LAALPERNGRDEEKQRLKCLIYVYGNNSDFGGGYTDFGVGRISKIGGELGSGIRAFKEGLAGEKSDDKKETPAETEKTNRTE